MKSTAWKKILYENQGYPDNYTDKTFLKELRMNIKFKKITFCQAIFGASLVIQELCTVIIFALIYLYLYNGWVEPSTILTFSTLITLFGFLIYKLLYRTGKFFSFGHEIRMVLIFTVFGQLFSPVLHTLTDTISTDTIYTMTVFMMLVHLIFFDYGISVAIVSNSLSLSAAVFGSICLASRLSSAYHAFVLLTVAIKIFVLFPALRKSIGHSIWMVVGLIALVLNTLLAISIVGSVLFVCALVLINLLCPLLYINYQEEKSNIYGPWDEAIVDDADDINDLIKN